MMKQRYTLTLTLTCFAAAILLLVLQAPSSNAQPARTSLDSGLVAWWRFDDSTARDASGNGNHGVLHGSPASAPGTCGAGLRFDGRDDYIRVPKSPSLLALQRMSVSYWIKFYFAADDPHGAGNSIGNGSDDLPRERGFYTYTGSTEISHFLGLQPDAVGVRMRYDATTPLDEKDYVFVTFTVGDDSLKAYMNGCLVATAARAGWPIARDWDWLIGWSGDNSGDTKFLDGYMDEIRLYNRALSDGEILDLYLQCGGKLRMEATPSPLGFGLLRCPATDSTMTITVSNVSDSTLTGSAWLRPGGAFEVVGGGSGDIGPHGSREVAIRFHPASPGAYSDTLVLEGDCTKRILIPISGALDSCIAPRDSTTDMAIAKTVSDSMPYERGLIVYTITLTNNGPNARLVEARDLVPPGIAVLGYTLSDPAATFDVPTATLRVPLLAVGASVTLDLNAVVATGAPDTIVNCAEITRVEGGDGDSANNRACAPLRVRRFRIPGLDLGGVPWCIDSLGRLVVRNTTADTFEVIAIAAPRNHAFSAQPVSLPRLLAPGDSMVIPISAIPGAEGAVQDSIGVVARRVRVGLPDTLYARLSVNGTPVLAAAAVDTQRAYPGDTVAMTVRLLTAVDHERVGDLRITVDYDSTFMLHVVRNGWEAMKRRGLLAAWELTAIDDRPGHLVVEARAPNDETYLKGVGELLRPTFRVVLGDHQSGAVDVAIQPLDRPCVAVRTAPGLAGVDSVCGLNYRLIERTSSVTKLVLRPNTPNPFTGTTSIAFGTPIEGRVRLAIHDSQGRRVALLVDADLPGGEHRVEWRAGDQPAGAYHCRLELGAAVRVIRMFHIK